MSVRKIFIAHSWTDVGVNIQTKAVATKLSQSYSVTFLTQARIGTPELKVNKNLSVLEWPNKRPNTLKDFFFIFKLIRKQKPDLLITHFGASVNCILASWLLRTKYRVCWLHTPYFVYKNDVKSPLEFLRVTTLRKLIYKMATHVVAISEFGKTDAVEGYKISAAKIIRIPNGILPPEKTGDRSPSGVISIRFISRIEKSKGIDILLQAFAKVLQQRNDVVLDIAGKGSDESYMHAFIEQFQLHNNIKYHGYFTNYNESVQFIRDAYCLVLPTKLDNFPTVVLEAMAEGVPVIASDIGGVPDMISHNKNGLLVNAEDVEGWAKAMLLLINSTELRNRLGEDARKTFNQQFTIHHHVTLVADFVNSLR